jgi:hypothetical protein
VNVPVDESKVSGADIKLKHSLQRVAEAVRHQEAAVDTVTIFLTRFDKIFRKNTIQKNRVNQLNWQVILRMSEKFAVRLVPY